MTMTDRNDDVLTTSYHLTTPTGVTLDIDITPNTDHLDRDQIRDVVGGLRNLAMVLANDMAVPAGDFEWIEMHLEQYEKAMAEFVNGVRELATCKPFEIRKRTDTVVMAAETLQASISQARAELALAISKLPKSPT